MRNRPVPAPTPAPHLLRLEPYHPGKPIAEVQRDLGITDVVKLASNENALGPSPRAIEAIRSAATHVHLYPEGRCPGLRAALASFLHVGHDQLVFGNGSDELIHLLGLAFLEPDDEVLMAVPTFVRYQAAAMLNRARCITVPLEQWQYDADALAGAVTDRTRVIFIANPNNPTGSYMNGGDVSRLLGCVPDRCVICFDEAYVEYVDANDYPDSLSLINEGANVVVLRTFSKIYGLAGLRIGYGIARTEIIEVLERVREPFNVNSIAQAAAVAALDDEEHRQNSREMVLMGRDKLFRALEQLGLRPYPSQGNFLWVDTGRDGTVLFQRLLRKGVIVRTGDIFGAPSFLRITIGTSEQMSRLVRALEEVLEK